MNTPKQYLSTSNGKWRVIFQGMPLCADCDRETAETCAKQYSMDPEKLPIWDGDIGAFRTLSFA